jgi:hypothetical protein
VTRSSTRPLARRTGRAVTVAMTILAMGLTFASAPSGAKPLERGHFHDASTEVVEDCGLTLQIDSVFDGSFLVNAHGPHGLVYGGARIHGTQTYTNLANGETLTIVSDGQDRDQRVTDNGDGTLTITVARPGRAFVVGPDGEVLFIDAGTVWFQILIDHAGTPNDPSDDAFIEFLGIVRQVGRTDTAGRDFCADLLQFIG